MDIPGNFQPIFKMNRLTPNRTPDLPLAVKFRTVLYDPNLMEREASRPGQENDQESDLFDPESALQAEPTFFYRDPLRLPDRFQEEKNWKESEQKDSSAAKLGKNMRSSSGLEDKGEHKKIFKLMEEGNRLLDLQKEELILSRRQLASEQMASVLVNDLLRNGFHITPPDFTPRSVDDPWTLPASSKMSSDEEGSLKNVVGGSQLIVAMHRELKRLQTDVTDIS